MARFLAIDWDQQELHVVSGATGRQGARIEQAFSWPLPEPLSTANDESIGRKLRLALKEAGIAPAPVLLCVGRERVILKELHYPPVPEADEPGVVRFQAVKELSEPADEVLIDYARLPARPGQEDRQALAVIVRKDVVHTARGLCRGLGLKLVGVTPRSVGIAGALRRVSTLAAGQAHAVVTVGKQWTEFTVFKDEQVQFTRSLPTGPNLPADVKRSVMVYAAQFGVPLPGMHVAAGSDGAALVPRLKEATGITVEELNPFREHDAVRVAPDRDGVYAGAIGVLHHWAVHSGLPINFVAIKEPRVAPRSHQRLAMYAAGGALVLIVVLAIAGRFVLSSRRAALDELALNKIEAEEQIKKLTQDRLDIEALKEWEQTTVPWIDEMYELTAMFPNQQGFRINQFAGTVPSKRNPKDKYIARIAVSGVKTADTHGLETQLLEKLNHDPHFRATLERSTQKDFFLKIDVARQAPEKYTAKIVPRPQPKGRPMAEEMMDPQDPDGQLDPLEGGAP